MLITGGTGCAGAALAHILVERGENVVLFDININHSRIDDIEDKVTVVRGGLGNWSEVLNVVKDNNVKGIYHTGSMLSLPSQANPWASFNANVIGTYNVLEAARLFDVEKVVFTSTLGTFGLEIGDVITDTTIQRPTLMYGIGKLYCEGLGRFYRTKFGLDYRGTRYPGVIGPGVTTPGAAQWFPWMIEHAIKDEPYESFAPEDAIVSVLFFKDCARVANIAYEAPKENVKMVNYNISGITPSISGGELADMLRKRYPGAPITFNPTPEVAKLWKTLKLQDIDDSCARKELGWSPIYNTMDKIVSSFEKEMKDHPKRYGLA